MGKSRQSADLVSDNNIFIDIVNDRVGIGTTVPTSKLTVNGDVTIAGVGTTALLVSGNARVTGILTVGTGSITLNDSGNITAGIITATSFYGDGQYLQNVISGVGVATAGGTVGTGATIIDFRGPGISTVTVSAGIATINITGGGGGGGAVSIGTVPPSSPSNGDLWYSPDYGRTFVWYNEVALGIGSTAVWVDASPFNLKISELDDVQLNSLVVVNHTDLNTLDVSGISTLGNVIIGSGATDLIVNGNARVTGILTIGTSSLTLNGNTNQINGVTISAGIITASGFSGSFTGNATGLSGTPDITVRNITGAAATFTGNVSIAGTLTYEDVTNVDSIGLVTARSGAHVATTSGNLLVGSATSTGTSSQPLQVTGGAYVSGSFGVGTTNPEAKFEVIGGPTLTGGELNLVVRSSSTSNIPATISQSSSASTLQVFSGGMANVSSRGGQIDFIAGAATTNPGTLIFRTGTSSGGTSQSERMRISADGNVGIGTTNPTSRLHLSGIGATTLIADQNRLRIGDYHWDNVYTSIHAKKIRSEWWLEQNSNDNDGVDLIFYKSRGTPNAELPVQLGDNIFRLTGRAFKPNAVGIGSTIILGDWTGDQTAQISFDVDEISGNNVFGRIDFRTQSTSRMVIKSTGNVGIGTTIPGSTLSVGGTITELSQGQYWNVVTQADVGIGASQVPLNQYLGQLAFIDSYSPSGLRRDGGGSDDVTVNSSGNIGIGTTNPVAKLVVNGSVAIGDTNTTSAAVSLGPAFLRIVNNNPSTTDGSIFNEVYSQSTSLAPGIILRRARGTLESQSQILAGDRIGFIIASGFGTTSFANSSAIGFFAEENHTETSRGTYIQFQTTSIGSAGRTEKVRITANGEVLIGSASSTGTASQNLQVTGGAYVSGNLGVGITNPIAKLAISDGTVTGEINPFSASSLCFIGTRTNHPIAFQISAAEKARLDTSGNLILGSSFTATGTASQPLQVNGGAYVSGNLGINSVNPSSRLSVGGTITELSNNQYWNVVTQADVGIGASQVPLNQYLGQLAFLDEFAVNIPQNAQTAAYTLVRADAGKHISITTGGVTVPAGVFEIGDVVLIYNNSSSNQTITQGASTTLRLSGTTSTGNRTLASYGVATVLCVASNTFVIYGTGVS